MAGPDGAETRAEHDRFNNFIAIAVALISGFMAVSSIKDDNISDAKADAQIETVETWNQYQAKRQRQFILDAQIAEMAADTPEGARTPAQAQVLAQWTAEVERYKSELGDLARSGRALEIRVAALDARGALFDLSGALLALSLAIFAVTALLRTRWLFVVACVIGMGGIVFGVGGFAGWTGMTGGWVAALFG